MVNRELEEHVCSLKLSYILCGSTPGSTPVGSWNQVVKAQSSMSSSLYVSFINLHRTSAIIQMGSQTTYRYIDVGGWSPLWKIFRYLQMQLKGNSLVGYVCIHQVWSHVIVVWVNNINLIYKISLLETQHATWVGKI